MKTLFVKFSFDFKTSWTFFFQNCSIYDVAHEKLEELAHELVWFVQIARMSSICQFYNFAILQSGQIIDWLSTQCAIFVANDHQSRRLNRKLQNSLQTNRISWILVKIVGLNSQILWFDLKSGLLDVRHPKLLALMYFGWIICRSYFEEEINCALIFAISLIAVKVVPSSITFIFRTNDATWKSEQQVCLHKKKNEA